jgi:hypothetical protein
MKKLKNRSGSTMLEVLIYMFVGLIVIGYALDSIGVISKGYVHTRTVMKMQKDGHDAVQILAREIANTGQKFYMDEIIDEVRHDLDVPGTYEDEDLTMYITRPSATVQSYIKNNETGATVEFDDRNWLYATYCGNMNVNNGELLPDFSASFIHADGDFANGVFFDTLTFYKMEMANATTPADIVRLRYYVTVTNGVGTLFRDELVSDNTELNTPIAIPNPVAANWLVKGNNIWGGGVSTVAILENVTALQFLYSQDGVTWINDPTDVRHLQKMVKIQLLVKSIRDVAGPVSAPQTLAEGTPSEFTVSTLGLHRLYEKIVQIPNNGIIQIPTPSP